MLTQSWHRTNLIIILGMMQVAKKIPFDDPNVLNICRAVYIASNLIILSIYLYIKATIDKKKGESMSSSSVGTAPAKLHTSHAHTHART